MLIWIMVDLLKSTVWNAYTGGMNAYLYEL